MLEKEMDKLRDKLIHGLQRKAIAKQFGLAIENDDVAQRERLAQLELMAQQKKPVLRAVSPPSLPALYIGQPTKERVNQMVNYVANVEELIDFHPEVNSNLVDVQVTT